jgi:hypothetical protein
VKSPKAGFATSGGNINLSGTNVTIGSVITDKKILGTAITTKTGALNVTTSSTGAFTVTGPKTTFTMGGALVANAGALNIDNAKITAKSLSASIAGDITLGLKLAITTIGEIRFETARNISLAAASSITSTKGKVQLLADLTDATLDGNNGLISLAAGSKVKAFAKAELAALTVSRTGALVSGKPVEVRNS